MKKEILDQVELIKKSDSLSLYEYCQQVKHHLPFNHNTDKWGEFSKNDNVKILLSDLKVLIDKGILPELKGFINIESILSSYEFDHEDYIETRLLGGDDTICMFAITNARPKGEYIEVNHQSIQPVSEFQESEIIVTSTELTGQFFIWFHDGEPILLSTNTENFIKALCSLSLMTDKYVFKEIFPTLCKNTYDLSNPLETLSRIVLNGSGIVEHIENIAGEEYDNFRDFYHDTKN